MFLFLISCRSCGDGAENPDDVKNKIPGLCEFSVRYLNLTFLKIIYAVRPYLSHIAYLAT